MDIALMSLWEAGYNLPPTSPPQPEQPKPKGVCRHCGKRVGRGLHFHEKACARVDTRNAQG